MPRRLRWGEVAEVSTVNAGANLKGRFPVTKGKKMSFKEKFELAMDSESPVDGEAAIAKGAESDEEKAAMVAVYRFADACGLKKMFEQPKPAEAPAAPEPVEVDKTAGDDGMKEEIEKRFEALNKQLKAKDAAIEAVNKQLDDAKDQRELDQWVAKAKENLQHVPGEFEELAKGLHEIAKVSPELASAQYATLCKTSEVMRKSDAFRAVGTGGNASATDEERVVKSAKDAVAKAKTEGTDPMAAFRAAAIAAEKE